MRDITILLAIVLFFGSCRSTAKKPSVSWNTITMVLDENEVIAITNGDDTSMVKTYNSGSIFMGWHKVKIDSMKVHFTESEKDTIFILTERIIENPADTKGGCTDFVGDLKITIDHGQYKDPGWFRQSIEYSGVCRWDTLSTETRQLNKILSRKIKWWHK